MTTSTLPQKLEPQHILAFWFQIVSCLAMCLFCHSIYLFVFFIHRTKKTTAVSNKGGELEKLREERDNLKRKNEALEEQVKLLKQKLDECVKDKQHVCRFHTSLCSLWTSFSLVSLFCMDLIDGICIQS